MNGGGSGERRPEIDADADASGGGTERRDGPRTAGRSLDRFDRAFACASPTTTAGFAGMSARGIAGVEIDCDSDDGAPFDLAATGAGAGAGESSKSKS